jgi:hypothetical protein
MKSTDKKELSQAPAPKTEQHTASKQTSGDKSFDNAIDKMLKKPVYHTPAK